jgi:hypothetical protein
MKKFISLLWVKALMGFTLCSILFAFSSSTGGHSVKVYLDSKLILDHYVDFKAEAPKLTVDPSEKSNQLIVKYNECGRTVTGRKITLKDDNNKVLKDWTFEGSSTGFQGSMECSMKDVLALKQKGSSTLKLYYSSKDFPEGHQIASLIIGGNVCTASK